MEEEMVTRATAAGNAAGLYLEGHQFFPPAQLVCRFRIGDRAWMEPVDVAAIEAAQQEIRGLEEAFGGIDVDALEREAKAGPLGKLEEGGA